MNVKNIAFILAAAIMLLLTFVPNAAFAVELSVRQNDATCVQTAATPCFTSIQAAVNYANDIISASTVTTTTFAIQVEAGTYSGAMTLGTGISSLKGSETARTILTGNGSGTLIAVNGGNPVISNFYFQNAQIGIDITNGATATIKNNIFNLAPSGTAVQLTLISLQTSISNNTFHSNNIAISGLFLIPIKNNIFSSNNTVPAVPAGSTPASLVAYNAFFENTNNPLINELGDGAGNISADPRFVDSLKRDFHLREDSPCIGTDSSSSDIGAYGSSTDTVPFQVSGVSAALDAADSTISVTWDPNLGYQVTGYRVWYGRTSGSYDGTGAAEGDSPISVPTGTFASTYLLSGLTATVSAPESPVLNDPSPRNKSLLLSWSAVPGATGYRVYYDIDDQTSSLPTSVVPEDIHETSYALRDLTNNVHYKVAVSAISQSAYYLAVTAVNKTIAGAARDESNESIYSVETPVGTGEIKESGLSNVKIEFPEAVIPHPNLPDSGKKCFIATAAYGDGFAPEVRALRAFRDRYLLTSSAGRAFVRWYYEHGPVAAAYIEAHPAYKPVVRAALMPAVGAALFMTKAPFFIRSVVALFILMIAVTIARRLFRKNHSGPGGTPVKTILLLLLALTIPAAAHAEEPLLERAHWSLELKGGTFAPALENWEQYYGSKDMPEYAGTLAYKVLRQVEIGVGAGMAADKGKGYAPIHNTLSGEVSYTLYPLNVFVLARGIINENQWLVPYVGGGWTRMYYRQKVDGQDAVHGSADGYHVRGGLQLSLNGLDRSAAHNMYMDYGVYHTYLFVEAERTKTKVKSTSVDLGGTAYLIGLLFEF